MRLPLRLLLPPPEPPPTPLLLPKGTGKRRYATRRLAKSSMSITSAIQNAPRTHMCMKTLSRMLCSAKGGTRLAAAVMTSVEEEEDEAEEEDVYSVEQ